MMRQLLAVLCMWLSVGLLYSQSVDWDRQFGTDSPDGAVAVTVQGSGVYIVGYSDRALPGPDSSGDGTVFLRKMDANGNVVWTRRFSPVGQSVPTSVAANGTGIYVVGHRHVDWLFIKGGSNDDAFVSKFSFNGEHLWTRMINLGWHNAATAVATSSSGVLVSGWTRKYPLSHHKGYLRLYAGNGETLWTRETDDRDSKVIGVAANRSDAYVTGIIGGEFPPTDTFVSRYNSAGTVLWTTRFSTSGYRVFGIVVDATGIYVAGTANTSPWRQLSPDKIFGFVRKYSFDGVVLWTETFPTGPFSIYREMRVAVGDSGIYIAGNSDSLILENDCSGYSYVRKFGANGQSEWTCPFGASRQQETLGIAATGSSVYTVGRLPHASKDQTDAFLIKLSLPD
jgi:hypothetical protein